MLKALYKKYQVTNYENLPALSPLSFILRKAELGHNLTDSEWTWLEHHQLSETIHIIGNQEYYRCSLFNEIKNELNQLSQSPFIDFIASTPNIDSERALILYQINAQENLNPKELRFGFINNRYFQLIELNEKKQKYGITENILFDSNAENYLDKLEKKQLFSTTDIEWLCTHKAYSFLTPLKKQFSQLQTKYKANLQDKLDVDLLFLFYILQKLNENKLLDFPEIEYLKTVGLVETLEISQKIEFLALKKKYRATQIQDEEINSHLFKVLKKLDSGLSLPEQDINYLKKRKLFETVKFAYKKQTDTLIHKIEQGHGLRPEDITWCEEHDFEEIIFTWLKKDYEVSDFKYKFESPLYSILKKLEANIRLTDDELIWLESEKLLYPSSKVFIVHHTLEAQFNESEFQRTKDYWKLANASAHWRKAEKPKWALKQTDDLDFKKIKLAKLRAALLTTRGGAFRDINEFNNAEQCALEAIKHFPDSHNPYTLMGALCYDTRRYDEGDKWFAEAVKRGAKPQDQDAEIKRILRKKKDKEREELIAHLLKKDSYRFAWVTQYMKT